MKGKNIKKYCNVKLLPALHELAGLDPNQNVLDIPEEERTWIQYDLAKDIRYLRGAVNGKTPVNLLFMVRPNTGTYLVREREGFIKGTSDHTIFTYYLDTKAYKAYTAYLVSSTDGKIGDIIPVDYAQFAAALEQYAVTASTLRLTYEEGELLQPEDRRVYDELQGYGKLLKVEYLPDDSTGLDITLSKLVDFKAQLPSGDIGVLLASQRQLIGEAITGKRRPRARNAAGQGAMPAFFGSRSAGRLRA